MLAWFHGALWHIAHSFFGFSRNSLLGYWSFNLTCDPVSIDFSNGSARLAFASSKRFYEASLHSIMLGGIIEQVE